MNSVISFPEDNEMHVNFNELAVRQVKGQNRATTSGSKKSHVEVFIYSFYISNEKQTSLINLFNICLFSLFGCWLLP